MAATESNSGPRRGVRHIILFVLSLLVFLALVSHDPHDSDFLAGGLGDHGVIRNWIGYFGAWVSRALFLVFGFAAYVLSGLLLLISARRLFGRRGLREAAWDYWLSVLFVGVGCSMFCGIWPDMAPEIAAALNIAETPGGVLGQRFCAPEIGWMRVILNPTGSGIVSFTLAAVGMCVVWLHDWHGLVRERMTEKPVDDAAAARKQAKEEKREAKRSRLAERRAARLRERELQQQGLDDASEPKEAPKKSKQKKKEEEAAELDTSAPPRAAAKPPKEHPEYVLPSADLLNPSSGPGTTADPKEVDMKKDVLQETLDSFGIDASVGAATSGPRVTLFEVLPAPGVKVEKISRLRNNIAMELQATSVRILTPIPGKKSVGIEVPNTTAATVSLRSLMETTAWTKCKAKLPVLLGRNISGKVVVLDLAKAPHLLIAGATGSGKSVCMNVLIMSMLYRFTPDELRLIMVDPKVVEFRAYASLPHLVVPVISDVKKVPLALRWTINEMEHRYQILAKVGARNIEGFNKRPKSKTPELDDDGNAIPEKLPFIVVVIDELADIMMTAKADVETSLARIAQLSRAVGIHTIIATQRPSVNVITGTIKANFPTRIAFQVTSQIDSRTIMDGKGAEVLLGRGDMLFRPPGTSGLERNQGAMVDDDELDRVVAFCADQAEQEFDESVFKSAGGGAAGGGAGGGDGAGGADLSDADEALIQQAIEIIVRDRRATTSYLQRCMRIGYNRAASIIEILEERGVIGPQVGTAPREILILGSGEGSVDDDGEAADDDVDVGVDDDDDGDVG